MKTLLKVLAMIAAAVLGAVIGISLAIYGSPKSQLGRALEEGQRYLSELQYEEAITSFRAALEIDPADKTAVDGIKDAYVGWADSLKDDDWVMALACIASALEMDNSTAYRTELSETCAAWIATPDSYEGCEESYDKLVELEVVVSGDGTNEKEDEILSYYDVTDVADADASEDALSSLETMLLRYRDRIKLIDKYSELLESYCDSAAARLSAADSVKEVNQILDQVQALLQKRIEQLGDEAEFNAIRERISSRLEELTQLGAGRETAIRESQEELED